MPPSAQGRWIELQLRPAARLTWWGPAWALICGTIASGGWQPSGRDLLRIGLALLLVDPVLGAVWDGLEALADDLHRPLSSAPDPPVPQPFRGLIRPGRRLARVVSVTATSLLLTLLLVAVLAILLGRAASWLILGAVLLAIAMVMLVGSHSLLWALMRALLEVGLAWVLALVLFRPGGLPPPAGALADLTRPVTLEWLRAHGPQLAPAILCSLTYFSVLRLSHGATRTAGWSLFLPAQAALAVPLILLQRPLLAAGILLLVAAQALFRPWLGRRGGAWFLHHTQFYVMAVMLLTAVGLRPGPWPP